VLSGVLSGGRRRRNHPNGRHGGSKGHAELKAQSDAFCKAEYKTFTGVAFTGAGGLVILPI
ncbi:MAG TPA: hypothetical protein DEG88_04905, partial [Propionibacteriaceae bacterium]|nr:hypothetical protein [Propionibacteriaceae bacterium]